MRLSSNHVVDFKVALKIGAFSNENDESITIKDGEDILIKFSVIFVVKNPDKAIEENKNDKNVQNDNKDDELEILYLDKIKWDIFEDERGEKQAITISDGEIDKITPYYSFFEIYKSNDKEFTIQPKENLPAKNYGQQTLTLTTKSRNIVYSLQIELNIKKKEKEVLLPYKSEYFTCDKFNFNLNGFIIEDLREGYGDGIYVIKTISDNEAELNFNENSEIQSLKIGSMKEIIQKICKKHNEVWNPSYIKTITPGKLKKDGDIWIIDEKVEIELRA